MKKASTDKEKCKACGLCCAYCPKGALIMTEQLNKRGYKHVAVDEALCIGCGICYTVCPDGVFTIKEE